MINPTMPCASHHWTLEGAVVGEAGKGGGVGLLGLTRLNRLGLHCLSELGWETKKTMWTANNSDVIQFEL